MVRDNRLLHLVERHKGTMRQFYNLGVSDMLVTGQEELRHFAITFAFFEVTR